MRGFSTIEIVLALAILTSAVTAVSLVVFGTPFMLASMQFEATALHAEDAALMQFEHRPWSSFASVKSVASSTTDGLELSLAVSTDQDEVSAIARAQAAWTDSYGRTQTSALETLRTNPSAENSCDSFVSSTWAAPQTRTYNLAVGDLLPPTIPTDTYPVADLAISGNTLMAAIRATTLTTSPTLFFFDISSSTQRPTLHGDGFDNASSSRIGYSAVTSGGAYAYAANGFGSASPQTCADALSCAQVHIFSLPVHTVGTGTPAQLVSSVLLATSTAPFALTSAGATAPANTLAYSNGFLYLGLQKTVNGDEFNILKVSDPLHPRWLSGMPIGRSVNHILIHDGFAYVGTDDNTQELIIFDVRDPEHPIRAGVWNAPGSVGFGLGTALRAYGSTLLLGRSYVSNAPELVALDIHDPSDIRDIDRHDLGTLLNPDSVRTLVPQDFLTFLLTTKSLQFWSISDTNTLSSYAPSLALPAGTTGTALACKESTLYVGLEQSSQSSGRIQVVTST